MVRSQNGWPAFRTPVEGKFVRFTAGGRGFWAASPDVAVVLGEYARRFHAEVEPIVSAGDVMDDWSFADRLIRGSTAAVSNHGSATAIDINATKHPLGVRGTFTAAKLARMRAIKNEITDDEGKPVLRLGADYVSRVDAMHVEINANAARVKQAADKIRKRDREAGAMDLTEQNLKDIGRAAADGVWAAQRAYTAADARALGDPGRQGEKFGVNVPLRGYSPGMVRLRREVAAGQGAMLAAIAALGEALAAVSRSTGAGDVLTVGQLQEAAHRGAHEALEELGRRLVEDPDDDDPAG
jgi:hypothetical protein